METCMETRAMAAALAELSISESGNDVFPPHCPAIEAAVAAIAEGKDPYAPRYWGRTPTGEAWVIWFQNEGV